MIPKLWKIWDYLQIRNEVDSDDEDLEREIKQKILDSISLEQGQLGAELVTILMKSVAQKDFVRNQFHNLKLRFFTYYGYFYGLQKMNKLERPLWKQLLLKMH